jgi:hypothetical protein
MHWVLTRAQMDGGRGSPAPLAKGEEEPFPIPGSRPLCHGHRQQQESAAVCQVTFRKVRGREAQSFAGARGGSRRVLTGSALSPRAGTCDDAASQGGRSMNCWTQLQGLAAAE